MGQTKHKQLMEAGGVSKLHLAVFQGKQEKVRKLLEKGCPDVNRGDKFGQTPLHIACHREGLLGCLKLLATHQADLRALDANGNTALHSAAGSGAAAAAEFLLGRGLSVADKNKDGHTPMDICNLHCPPDKQKSMQIMLEGGAKVEEDRAAGGDSTAACTPAREISNEKYSSSNNNNNVDPNASAAAAPKNVAPAFETGSGTEVTPAAATAGHDAGAGAVAVVPPSSSFSASGGGGGAGDGSRGSFEGAPVTAPGTAAAAAAAAEKGVGGNVPATAAPGTADRTQSPAPSSSAAAAAAAAVVTPPAEAKKSSRGTFLSALYRGNSGVSSSAGGTSFASTTVDSPRSKSPLPEPPRSAASAPTVVPASSSGRGDGGVEEYKASTSVVPATSTGGGPADTAVPAGEGGGGAVVAAGGGMVAAKSTEEKRSARKRAALQELHLAIFQGDTAKVEEVVQRGDLSALNQADRHGQTPLHLACYKGSRVMTRLLVEGGADLNAVDVNGNGVVHAAVCDSPAVLAILIDHGADTTVSNYDGLTPKRLCEQYCPPRLKERMLQLLREGALARAKDVARQDQLAEDQTNIEAVYHQLAMLRSKMAATAAANTQVPASAAAEGAQTENALLTLVEANLRVVEGQRHALENMERTTARLERMFRRLHMRMDSVSPGDVSFS